MATTADPCNEAQPCFQPPDRYSSTSSHHFPSSKSAEPHSDRERGTNLCPLFLVRVHDVSHVPATHPSVNLLPHKHRCPTKATSKAISQLPDLPVQLPTNSLQAHVPHKQHAASILFVRVLGLTSCPCSYLSPPARTSVLSARPPCRSGTISDLLLLICRHLCHHIALKIRLASAVQELVTSTTLHSQM